MVNSFFLSDQPDALLRFLPADAPQRNDMKGLVFILTTRGRAMVEVDGRSCSLIAGSMLTLLPSHLVQTLSHSEDYQCLTLAFPFDAMADFPYLLPSLVTEKMEQSPLIKLSEEEYEFLVGGFAVIRRHYALVNHPSY